jgi:hypothetical protein
MAEAIDFVQSERYQWSEVWDMSEMLDDKSKKTLLELAGIFKEEFPDMDHEQAVSAALNMAMNRYFSDPANLRRLKCRCLREKLEAERRDSK